MIKLIIFTILMFSLPSSAQLGIYNGGVPQHLRVVGHSYNDSDTENTVVADAIGFDFDSSWFWVSANGGTAHYNGTLNGTTVADDCTAAEGYNLYTGCRQGINQVIQVDSVCRFPTEAQQVTTYRHNFGASDEEATCLTDLSARISLMPKERICIIDHQINDLKGASSSPPATAVIQFNTNFRPSAIAAIDDMLDAFEAQGYRCILVSDTPYMGTNIQTNEIRINRNAQLEDYTSYLKDTYLQQGARSQHEIADVWTEFTQFRNNYGDTLFAQLFANCANLPPTSCVVGGTCDDVPVGCTDGNHPGFGAISLPGSAVTFTGRDLRAQIISRAVGVLKQRIRDNN